MIDKLASDERVECILDYSDTNDHKIINPMDI